MKRLAKGLLWLSITSLTACGVTPATQHYVLTSQLAPAPEVELPLSLGIGPIQLADYLDRIQITLRTNNTLTVDEFNRWGEPLDSGITRVLAEQLGSLIGASKLVMFPWRSDEIPDYRVKVIVLQLDRSNLTAQMKARWSIGAVKPGATPHRELGVYQTALRDDSYEALAAGYSELVHQLSQDIGRFIIAVSRERKATRAQ